MITLYIDIIGYAAGFFLILMSIPQITNIIRTKQANGISYHSMLLDFISRTFFLIYGILIISYPVIVASFIRLVCILVIVILKYKYKLELTASLAPTPTLTVNESTIENNV